MVDKPIELPNDKNKNKNPVDSAIAKMKEAAANELGKKVAEAVKELQTANKVKNAAITKLKHLLREGEVEKAEMAELLKELK